MTEKDKKEAKKIDLEQFIKDHYQMFTVLGVFGALTALFTKLENASYLAFFSFVIFIILDVELWIKFPKSEEATLSMKIFEALLQIYLVLIGIYLIQAYPDYVAMLLPTFFILLFAGIFFIFFTRFKLFEPIRKVSPPFRKRSALIRIMIGMLITISLLILAVTLGTLLANLIKYYFEYPPIT